MRKAPPLILTEKIDTKVTADTLAEIKKLMLKEERTMANTLRVLILRGLKESNIEADIR